MWYNPQSIYVPKIKVYKAKTKACNYYIYKIKYPSKVLACGKGKKYKITLSTKYSAKLLQSYYVTEIIHL